MRRSPKPTPLLELAPPPPQNLDAERALLGAAMVSARDPGGRGAVEVLLTLAPADFFESRHRLVFHAIRDLSESAVGIDEITVADKLRLSGNLETVGQEYLTETAKGLAIIMQVEHYARIVKEKSLLRELIHITQDIQLSALDAKEEPSAVAERGRLALDQIIANASNGQRRNGIVVHDLSEFRVAEFPAREPYLLIASTDTPLFTSRSTNSGLRMEGYRQDDTGPRHGWCHGNRRRLCLLEGDAQVAGAVRGGRNAERAVAGARQCARWAHRSRIFSPHHPRFAAKRHRSHLHPSGPEGDRRRCGGRRRSPLCSTPSRRSHGFQRTTTKRDCWREAALAWFARLRSRGLCVDTSCLLRANSCIAATRPFPV